MLQKAQNSHQIPKTTLAFSYRKDNRKIASIEERCPLNPSAPEVAPLSTSEQQSSQHLKQQIEQLNRELQKTKTQKNQAIKEKQELIVEKEAMTNHLQNLLSVLPSGIVLLDPRGMVRDCNAVAIDILSRPLLGEFWLSVIQRVFLPQADDGHQISLRDGRKIHIETRALDPGQMIVLTDMTKTRQLQAELSQQQKLSSLGKMIASLAHQIRTPLSAALLYASHLKGEKLTVSNRRVFSFQLMERLQFMDQQISDMLDFVKGERKQKESFTAIQLIESVKMACYNFSNRICFKSNTIDFSNKQMVGSLNALVSAINNLIDNAMDASGKEQTINVKFSVEKKKYLNIQVEDKGVGIELSHQGKLFEPFYTTKNHGNGLGLSIVHGVVLEHQGKISLKSEIGKGSCFTIRLPLYLSDKSRTTKQPKKKILTSIKKPNSNTEQVKKTVLSSLSIEQEVVHDD